MEHSCVIVFNVQACSWQMWCGPGQKFQRGTNNGQTLENDSGGADIELYMLGSRIWLGIPVRFAV